MVYLTFWFISLLCLSHFWVNLTFWFIYLFGLPNFFVYITFWFTYNFGLPTKFVYLSFWFIKITFGFSKQFCLPNSLGYLTFWFTKFVVLQTFLFYQTCFSNFITWFTILFWWQRTLYTTQNYRRIMTSFAYSCHKKDNIYVKCVIIRNQPN